MLPERLIQPVPICAECGAPASTESPLYEAPPGTAVQGNMLCPVCTARLAQRILQGPNRAIRRARAAGTRLKGDRNRKRKRR